ncbi:MAG: glycoside hydrolase family 44 protein [Anaerolineales bacterium]
MKRLPILFSLIFLIPLAAYFNGVTQAAASSRGIAPAAMVTLKGGTSGAVANLAVQDQSGAVDTPSKYVKFTTPGTALYSGYRSFSLPTNIAVSGVTAMNVKVNYKGLPKASQRWSWSLYDWTAKKWVYIGDNTGATNNTWFAVTFSTTSPKRFISASREIRLLLQSGNAGGDAKLDFESVNVTYTTPLVSSSVYGDALVNGWGDWSWGDAAHNLAITSPVHGGAKAISVTYGPAGWSGLQFGRSDAFSLGIYDTLRFWVHGGVKGGQVVVVQVGDGTTTLTKAITPKAGTWTQVDMSLAGLSQVTLLAWFNNTAGAQPVFYLDDVAFISSGAPTPTPTLTPPPSTGPALSVDAGANRHAISPYIYGMNFAEETLAADIDLPVRRWGGNSTTRYNWQTNMQNTGSDWYFENLPADVSADDFVAQNVRTNTQTLMTIPLIGWTPKATSPTDHPYDCGFKVSIYGAQDSTDQWDPNCGNGVSGGADITGNNPADTSMAIGPNWVTGWINHLTSTYGTAANGGVMFYNLDNEPMLWNSTHRDVHPAGVSYDELRDKTFAIAAAVKAADPSAKTLGPVEWGWCAYFYSGADGGCQDGPDRQAHGGLDWVVYYLQQMKAYEQAHGVRILDYFDLHSYPYADGVSLSPAGNAATQALRLRSTRSLWDPTYIDESWVGTDLGQAVYTIPRMKAWVAANYPGTKTAISEYNWGALDDINGALAQADVLGIFGREGLDLATLWGPPTSTQPGAYAFRMYLNYDGSHSKFGDTGVSAASADQSKLAVYAAQRTGDSALTLIVINKTGGGLTSALSLAGFTPSGSVAQVYRYSAANLNAIQHLADQTVSASGFTATYPANSITLLVIPGSAP